MTGEKVKYPTYKALGTDGGDLSGDREPRIPIGPTLSSTQQQELVSQS